MERIQLNWEKINENLKKQEQSFGGYKKKEPDKRFFKPVRDVEGNGEYILRFLPSSDTDLPYVMQLKHNIVIGGKYLIQDCPLTIGNECPIDEYASTLWGTGVKVNKDLAKMFWKKTTYIVNILIVSDESHPENNGKIFLWEIGNQIFEKMEAYKKKLLKRGLSEIDVVKRIFDYYEGTNFNLSLKSKEIPDRTDPSKMRSVPNYEDSAFETVEPIGNDEKIEKIHNSLFKLAEFIDPKKYKSKEELNAELSKFLIKAGIDNKLLPEINSSVPVKVQNSNESTVPVNVQLPVNEPIAPEDVADIPLNVVEDEDEFIKSIRMKND